MPEISRARKLLSNTDFVCRRRQTIDRFDILNLMREQARSFIRRQLRVSTNERKVPKLSNRLFARQGLLIRKLLFDLLYRQARKKMITRGKYRISYKKIFLKSRKGGECWQQLS